MLWIWNSILWRETTTGKRHPYTSEEAKVSKIWSGIFHLMMFLMVFDSRIVDVNVDNNQGGEEGNGTVWGFWPGRGSDFFIQIYTLYVLCMLYIYIIYASILDPRSMDILAWKWCPSSLRIFLSHVWEQSFRGLQV